MEVSKFKHLHRDDQEVSKKGCALMKGNLALFLQFLIAFLAFLSLIYKRRIEKEPRRNNEVWMMDICKQIIQGIFVHFCNIGLAIFVANANDNKWNYGDMPNDECAFYFITFTFDTFLGILIIMFTLNITSSIARYYHYSPLVKQGYYGEPPQYGWYFIQTITFIFATIVSKLFLTIIMLNNSKVIDTLASTINTGMLSFIKSPQIELCLVMFICPFVMSIIQYWIVDNFLHDNDNDNRQKERTAQQQGYDGYYGYQFDDDETLGLIIEEAKGTSSSSSSSSSSNLIGPCRSRYNNQTHDQSQSPFGTFGFISGRGEPVTFGSPYKPF